MMQGSNAAIRVLGRGSKVWGATTMSKAATRTMSRSSAVASPRLATIRPSSNPTMSMVIKGEGKEFSSTVATNSQRWFSSSTVDESTKKEEEKAEETAAASTEEEAAAAAEDGEESKEEDEFQAKLSKLQDEVKTLKDQLLRSLAEQENTRQIAKRDVTAAKNFAIKSFAKSLLEVSDNLHRALDAVPDDAMKDGDENNNLKTLYEGVKMTNDGLTKAFTSNGIKAFCQQPGDVFDPTMHEALMEYPDPSKEPGTVGQVIKVGFTLNDRVLRPAEVGVVKKP